MNFERFMVIIVLGIGKFIVLYAGIRIKLVYFIIYLSITVAVCIIQISLTDLAIREPAIAIKRPVSTLKAFGIIIPRRFCFWISCGFYNLIKGLGLVDPNSVYQKFSL